MTSQSEERKAESRSSRLVFAVADLRHPLERVGRHAGRRLFACPVAVGIEGEGGASRWEFQSVLGRVVDALSSAQLRFHDLMTDLRSLKATHLTSLRSFVLLYVVTDSVQILIFNALSA